MPIVDFDFYTNTYYGDGIKEPDFPKWESRAEDELMYLTNGNITSGALAAYEIQIKKAICALCEVLAQLDEVSNATGAVRSISSGGESVSYGDTAISAAATSKKAQMALKFDTVRPYLHNTGLLYQGL